MIPRVCFTYLVKEEEEEEMFSTALSLSSEEIEKTFKKTIPSLLWKMATPDSSTNIYCKASWMWKALLL
jgi:hypothetical protein